MRVWWTMPERRKAAQLREQGYSYGAIACLLARRTPDAVAAHLRSLRLSQKAEEGKSA